MPDSRRDMQELDFLVLGAGWTATFLLPLLRERGRTFAATTRDGRSVANEQTISWSFDPKGSEDQFAVLPLAKHILITFPLLGPQQASLIVQGYKRSHERAGELQVVQLGSSGIWQIPREEIWVTRKSSYDTTNQRAIAEDELLSLGGSVLNLSGLWGGARDPRTWVDRVAKSKEDVSQKKSVHFIHGLDVARALVAVSDRWQLARGQRWMLTDGFVYDWWSLMASWADASGDGKQIDRPPSKTAQWVYELMLASGVAALPRSMEALGRCYDSREFWSTFELIPLKAGV